ncbi:MAG: hypothetical protein O9301_14370 [Leptospira sp.]|nr:hypothetical protein [Leptospira sp.]
MILIVFLNLNIVDDRFVSPLEDLDYQYQSYELEETTRVLSVSKKSEAKLVFLPLISNQLPSKTDNPSVLGSESPGLYIRAIHLNFNFIYLPPPSLA